MEFQYTGKTILNRNERGETIAVTGEENRTVSMERDIMAR